MTYKDQLLSNEWKSKRKEILSRDNFECTICKNKTLINNCLKGKILDIKNTLNTLFLGWGSKEFPNFDVKLKLKNGDKIDLNMNLPKEFIKWKQSNVLYSYPVFFERKSKNVSINFIEKNGNLKYISGLHIHHKVYQLGKMAWEYPNEVLITLCGICHKEMHKNEEIPKLDKIGRKTESLIPCKRCFGRGIFEEFLHINEGICFRCNGKRFE